MSLESLFQNANRVMGASERGPGAAELRDYLTTGGQNLDPATTAWCAAFVNATLSKSGMQGTGALNARSYLDWGQPVDQPQRGDVAVFSRGDPNGWQGHVGFFDSFGPDGKVNVLGGNQGDRVSIAGYDPGTLLGFRRAPDLTFGEPQASPATPGFVPPAGGEDDGLAALFAAPRQRQEAQENRHADEQARRRALFDGLPGLYR